MAEVKLPQNDKVSKTEKTTPKATIRKKSLFKKMVDSFIQEDLACIGDAILNDIIVPTAKETVLQVVETCLGIKSSRRGNVNTAANRVQWTSYDRFSQPESRMRERSRTYRTYEYNDVEFYSKEHAQDALQDLEDLINKYGHAKVSDLYQFAGVTGTYTDQDYGWFDLRSAYIEMVRSIDDRSRYVWIIKLPKAERVK